MWRAALLLVLLLMAVVSAANIAEAEKDEGRIVNGTEVPHGKYPFMVSIRLLGMHWCGGSIVNSDWVMTAAHCFPNMDDDLPRLTIHSATTKLNVEGNIHNITQLKMHLEYNKIGLIENDIALLKVSPPFPKGGYEAAVNLPKAQHRVAPGSWLSVTGWGLDRAGGNVQDSLMEVDLKVLNDDSCEIPPFQNEKICAVFPDGGKGACLGDSGGPLVSEDHTQLGIVSYGDLNCGGPNSFTIFTEVTTYIDWINNIINN